MRTLVLVAGIAIRGALSVVLDECPGYAASNIFNGNGTLTADLTLAGSACNAYGTDLVDLKLLVEYQTENRLHVKIYDAAEQVYQVQEDVIPRPESRGIPASDSALQFSLTEDPFSFTVTRSESGEAIFSTNGSSLVFESQFVHLRTSLPTDPNLYGLGEHSDSFRLPTTDYERVLWNAESPFIPRGENLYGSHPMYLEHRIAAGGNTSQSHGVFLLNANGMSIVINRTESGGQYLEYNTLGGVLDFYFLAGPTPTDVTKQYAEVVGLPAMMPYWTLGFQQSKYGYWDVNQAAEVVANYSTAGIPLEVLWGDIDYMDYRQVFTLDPERFPLHKMRELVQTLHDRGQKYVMMLDPGIHQVDNYSTYARGLKSDVFLKAEDGSPYCGVQWAGVVVWPDWMKPETQTWWTNEILEFFDPETGLDVDGIWNDMNEASNFVPNITMDPALVAELGNNPPEPQNPPRNNTGRPIPGFPDDFQPQPSSNLSRTQMRTEMGAREEALRLRQETTGDMKGLPDRDLFTPPYHLNSHNGELSDSTIFTNTSNSDGTVQYDTHNLYGTTMARTTRRALLTRSPARRPFVLTRSTFAGVGAHAAHWFGDNNSTWSDYRVSVAQLLGFASVLQVPMVGSDVCGFNGASWAELCARWALLGAFMPFYRNHADISAPAQEFYLWDGVAAAARKAVDARYRLLDYVYTALHRASAGGEPVVSPLFYAYPGDAALVGVQTQWFLGAAVLVAPVMGDDGADSVDVYLPDDVFYDFWTGAMVRGTGANVTVGDLGWADIPVYLRGGTVVPLRVESANTTSLLREKDFEIVVAPGTDGAAAGSLYLDDGESLDVGEQFSDIQFTWDGSTFRAEGTYGYPTELVVQRVIVLGADGQAVHEGSWSLHTPFEFTVGS
ncbi:glycoside hydrolase family 31 protein [Xylariomycetidae sp. FL2044]|nr:glycoside hydrolase family 31 protein [Xylariomycetidae sp. FL2044]